MKPTKTALFRAILIETCNTCTRSCWFCKFGQERQDEVVTQMDWETIRTILENLKVLQYNGRISWYNINEPLLDKRMPEIVRMTREYCPQAFISLATNGDLLDENLWHTLKANGLDALGISIYDERTFEKARKYAGRQIVPIEMRSVGDDLLENRGGGIQKDIAMFERDRIRFLNHSCERPFAMIVVNSQGRVVLCCDDLYGDVIMGDVHSQRLEEIWNNERFAFYRNALDHEGRRNLMLCSKCSYSGKGFRPFFPFFDEIPPLTIRDRICAGLERIWNRLERK